MKNWENDSQDENNWNYPFISHLRAHTNTQNSVHEGKHCHVEWSAVRKGGNWQCWFTTLFIIKEFLFFLLAQSWSGWVSLYSLTLCHFNLLDNIFLLSFFFSVIPPPRGGVPAPLSPAAPPPPVQRVPPPPWAPVLEASLYPYPHLTAAPAPAPVEPSPTL